MKKWLSDAELANPVVAEVIDRFVSDKMQGVCNGRRVLFGPLDIHRLIRLARERLSEEERRG